MARFTGKNLVVMVEDSAASEAALGFVYECDVNFEAEDVEFRGDDIASSKAGQKVAEVIVRYEHDNTASTGNHVILSGIFASDTPRFVRVRPLGTGSSVIEFAMDAVLLKFGPTGVQRGDKLMAEARFKNHSEASADPAWGSQSA